MATCGGEVRSLVCVSDVATRDLSRFRGSTSAVITPAGSLPLYDRCTPDAGIPGRVSYARLAVLVNVSPSVTLASTLAWKLNR